MASGVFGFGSKLSFFSARFHSTGVKKIGTRYAVLDQIVLQTAAEDATVDGPYSRPDFSSRRVTPLFNSAYRIR